MSQAVLEDLLCGPVVGLVTHNTANILLEFSTPREYTFVVQCKQPSTISAEPQRIHVAFSSRQPQVFHIDHLVENTEYVVTLEQSAQPCATFRTLPLDPKELSVIVISCNKLVTESEVDMWQKLYECVVKQGVHIVLHIGDQVYIDGRAGNKINEDNMFDHATFEKFEKTPYIAARWILKDVQPEDWPSKRNEILELYRDCYRQTWNIKYCAATLANVSNLMIWDDHEVRNDFGSHAIDSQRDSVHYFLGSIAHQCYQEYQRQLWDYEDCRRTDIYSEFHCHIFSSIGFMFLDERGPFSIFQWKKSPNDRTYFGQEQTDQIKNILHSENSVKMWIIASSVPTIYLKASINRLASDLHFMDDTRAYMNYEHLPSLLELWDEFRVWKETGKGERDVLIVCGDVHLGCFTNIYYTDPITKQKSVAFRQVISSAIRNHPWDPKKFFVVKSLLSLEDRYGSYSYRHFGIVGDCNFIVVKVKFEEKSRRGMESKKIKYQEGNAPMKLQVCPKFVIHQFYERGDVIKRSDVEEDWREDRRGCCDVI